MKTLIAGHPWITALLSTGLPVIGTSLSRYFMDVDADIWTNLKAGLGGALFATVVLAIIREPKPLPKLPKSVENKVFSESSVRELIKLTRRKMTIQVQDATRSHLGTWLVCQGRVQDLSNIPGLQFKRRHLDIYEMASEKGRVRVVLEHGFLGFRKRIVAYFYVGLNRIRTLPHRKKITVVGEIKAIRKTGITLENCELV